MAAPQQAPAEAAQPLKTRPKTPPKPQPDHCLNCGAGATGKFCAQCGQEIKDHSVSLGPLLSEGLAELASWDSKLIRTLIPLLFCPGFLTNQYNTGKRVPYLSPLKLYLTVSVLFFLLLSWTHPVGSLVHIKSGTITIGGGRDEPVAASPGVVRLKHHTAFERTMARGAVRANQSPAAFIASLLGDIPKMMFLLLPLFAVSLKLLYWRPKRLYVEHLIFLLHVHAFAFLLLTPLLLVHPDWLVGSISLALTVYVLAAMRVVYKQGWLATIWKFSLLGFGYLFLLSLCIVGTMLVALWLY